MKTIFTKFLAFSGILLLMLSSCKKDETKVVATNGKPGALTATADNVVLTSANADNVALSFNFTPSSYGYKAAITYTLQVDVKGDNFAKATNVSVSGKSFDYKVSDFNNALVNMGLIPGTTAEVEARIKSELGTNVSAAYSNVLTITVTPYASIITYPSLYVPGAYQGWSPPTAERISSVKDDKTYEGYVNFSDAGSLEFKYTSDPDWNHTNYGDGGAGSLSTDGGAGNLKVPSTGYFLLKGDLNAKTWSVTKTAWGIIGDATPNGWNSSTPLTYDSTNKVWSATVTLTGGLFVKFRANDAWDINLGDNKPANGVLKYGGENIPVAETGTYKITLDLSHPAYYIYRLIKQ
ncbi:SusE domain-containing protein [Mucilaginibacter sp. BJC16-A38]|uniref:SusE domain-containing protein n=1 Tax=Mucilaginibacter phenanthrenivorans TaxID=1234842 RepID=UPI0021589622|nr:SusE domain-containing protein [Mucilaginibacter phenanthrenivorans]MCR8559874.1 SusE domain-containing protein [Mucilaginibacter phenanthrenivorans]